MSYPWWKFRVTYENGTKEEFIATGPTVTDAIRELTDYSDPEYAVLPQDHDVFSIEFIGMAEGYEDCIPSSWRDRLVKIEEVQHETDH